MHIHNIFFVIRHIIRDNWFDLIIDVSKCEYVVGQFGIYSYSAHKMRKWLNILFTSLCRAKL